jgi:L-amino acid N-acyltransferase YncA
MLEDYPKEIVLKGGIPIHIRPAVKEDERKLVEFFASIPANERWFLREDVGDPVIMGQWLSKLDYSKMLPLVAVLDSDGSIIANIRIHRRQSRCVSHIAHLRIMVHPAFRGLRLGNWMLVDTVKLAMDMGIEKLVAEFVAGVEDAGINAAYKLDFHEEGLLKEYVKDPKGKYKNLVIMVKNIHRDWSDF